MVQKEREEMVQKKLEQATLNEKKGVTTSASESTLSEKKDMSETTKLIQKETAAEVGLLACRCLSHAREV